MNPTEQIEESVPPPLRHYSKIAIRRRWWLIISTFVFWAGALILSLVVTPKYKSETTVLIDQPGASGQDVTSGVNDLQQRLQSLTEQTLSRPRLLQLIEEFHLYGNEPGQTVSDSSVQQMRADITVEVTRSTSSGEISAFKIGYSAPAPELAQKVTARLASLFIQDSLARQQRRAEQTTSFLEGQLEEARKDLEAQDGLLRDFRSRSLGELPEQRASNAQVLLELRGSLQSARESLNRAEKQKLYLGTLLGWSVVPPSNTTGAGDVSVTPSTPRDEQLDKMKSDLSDLRARYTERHPDVVHLKEEIANVERMKSRMATTAGNAKTRQPGGPPETLRTQGTVSQISELQSEFKANELEIANRKREISQLEGQIPQYQDRLNASPLREQQLAEFTRKDEQARAHYESLLAKKQQSEMAKDLSQKQQNQIFQQVDPPTSPQRPYFPNRLAFTAIGFFLGIVVGFVAIAIKETVDARICGEDDLSQWVNVPVIATIPPLTTKAEKKRQARRLGFEIAVALVLAMLVPVLTIMAYTKS
jgi:polysaccharide chain length determinant protein (PEP-CTERM system associated)